MGINQTMAEKRLEICESCPIYKEINKIVGGVCSSYLYLNPITGEISTKFKEGFFRGCGCRLNAKTRLKNQKCPSGKW